MDQTTALKLMRKGADAAQAGKPRDARRHLEKVLKAYPQQPDALHLCGLAWLQEGRLKTAESLVRQAIALRPQEAGYLANLAIILNRAGRHGEAAATARAALKRAPAQASALDTLARASLAAGAFEDAAAALAEICRINPRDPTPRIGLAEALTEAGQPTAAAAAYRQALTLAPDALPALIGLSRLEPPAVFAPEALAALDAASALRPDDADLAGQLSAHLEQANRLAEAAAAAERAIKTEPGAPLARLTEARLAMRDGDMVRAGRALDAIDRTDLDPTIAAQVAWVEAQQADRAGDTAAAVIAMERAHALHRQTAAVQAVRRTVLQDRAEAFRAYLRDRPDATPHPVDPTAPVFFVGYPRSGTTLMEQILAAHPALVTTAEEPFLSRVIMDLPRLLGRPFHYPTDLATLTPAEAAQAAAHYTTVVEASLGPLDGRRIVDKLPLNLVELPIIERLFPGAAVIVALRDPRDVVLSNVMQLFAPNAASIHSDSVEGCAQAYALVMDLWETYSNKLALPRLVYRYEDLVADFEPTVRQVIDFLGLPWDDAVLDYTEKARGRHIQTPSYSRAGNKPDQTAVGRWHRYGDWLAPALPKLAPYVDRYGYTP